jgi:hypothetical protein
LNRWITLRTLSSSAATNRAIAATGVLDADAMMIIAGAPDQPVSAPPHNLLQPAALLISQPPRPHRLSHHTFHTRWNTSIECGSRQQEVSADPVNVHG